MAPDELPSPRWTARGWRIAAWVAGTRLLAEVAMVAGSYFPKHVADYWHGQAGSLMWFAVPHRWVDVWARWDTMFYLAIAQTGYPPADPSGDWIYTAAYFPVLPLLMRGLSVLLGGIPVFYAGVLVVNAMLVLAVVYLDKLLRLDGPPAFAELTLICLMAYPGSHFFSCVYPESTALFLAVFAVYCARTRLYPAAALACLLLVVTRASGWVGCIPVLYELLRRPDGSLRPSWKLLWFALPVISVALYCGLNWQLYRDPLYFIHVEAGWGRKPTFPLLTLLQTNLSLDFHLFALAGMAAVGWGLYRRQRPGYVAMGAVGVFFPLSTGLLNGVHRYSASNYPLFIFLADALKARPRWQKGCLVLGLALLALYSFKWGQGFQPN